MNTEMLIAELSRDLRPVPAREPRKLLSTGLIAGGLVAGAAVLFWPSLGIRSDLGTAVMTGMFWVKLLYTGSLAVLGFRLLDHLSRPGFERVHWGRALAVPLLALAVITVLRVGATPVNGSEAFWMGSSWLQCPLYVAALAAPVFVGLLWSLSRLAPTRLAEAGAAAGLVAGGTGATVYALHCAESSPGFVLIWYSLGLAAAALAGAAIGSRLLRW
ncbi:MAG: DUF1109 domain-containing protein [Cupriavidus sp.]|nr:MAG: DUF1109 domain-containing protein [Cupriavidus sp.]